MSTSDDIISRIHAREVLDSRGQPTVEVEVHCRGGAAGRAIVPSGASTGTHEAKELRDGNLTSGGLRAGGNLDFQDFLRMPIGARSYSEPLEMTVAVYRPLSAVLREHGFEGVLVGDEGGFGPRLQSNEQAVQLALAAIER